MNVVAGLHHGHERRQVGVRPAVRLNVGKPAAEHLLGALDSQGLDLIVELAPAVVAGSRISLGILVSQDRPGRLAHRRRDMVFAGDQFQRRLLRRFSSLAINSAIRGSVFFRLILSLRCRKSLVKKVHECRPTLSGATHLQVP